MEYFHYTDRPAGRGYTGFGGTRYRNRPWVWPPLKRGLQVTGIVCCVLALPFVFLIEW